VDIDPHNMALSENPSNLQRLLDSRHSFIRAIRDKITNADEYRELHEFGCHKVECISLNNSIMSPQII